jgi:hypothetical protein
VPVGAGPRHHRRGEGPRYFMIDAGIRHAHDFVMSFVTRSTSSCCCLIYCCSSSAA